jgi:hypothetical protein
MRKTLNVLVALALGLASFAAAQTPPTPPGQAGIDELKKTAVKVYLDCDFCDTEYIKTEITFVNYVRDRLEAQVHILITTQATGGGGVEYTLTFIGQGDYKDARDLQKYYSSQTDTDDDVRRGLVKALKLGLMSFVARTPIAGRIAVDYAPPEKPAAGRDRWNYWLFSLSGEGRISGEESYLDRMAGLSFSANRVTPASKVRLGLMADRSYQKFEVDGDTITGTTESWSATGLYVLSLGEHWSVGANAQAESSLYSNIDLGLSIGPAVEYDFFPYSQSTRRQLRALYSLSLEPVKYREETIYGKTEETLFQQELSLTLDLREKFGTVSLSAEGANYLHDFSKYHIDLFSILNLRLYKGFSVYCFGGYSWVHDQLSLIAREPTYEEMLLRLHELPMTDNYFVAVGFQFQFGSIFTNVINPRFGTSGSGGMRIEIH